MASGYSGSIYWAWSRYGWRKQPVEAVEAMFEFMAERLEASDWAEGW